MEKTGATLILFSLMVVVAVASSVYAGDQWYENGNLHKSTMGEWKRASYSNKLATSADMCFASEKIKALVRKSGSIDTLKPFARDLATCIDKAVPDRGYETMSVAEVAAMCIIMMKW